MNRKRTVESVTITINEFFKRRSIKQVESPWILAESPLGGLGVFAGKDIEQGEEIYRDFPIILGPRVKEVKSVYCVACFKRNNLKPCSKKCGLPLCSEECENIHQSECEMIRKKRSQDVDVLDQNLFRIYTPLQALLLDEDDRSVIAHLKYHRGKQHGFEVDELILNDFSFERWEEIFLRLVCCVMDANAFEVLVGNEVDSSNLRGLYPLASLANHSCAPNTTHVFDRNRLMVVKACLPIKQGEELFHSYARLIWSTPARIYHLSRTKHFLCRCPRCSDPTEFGSYMSAFLCKTCKGNVIPRKPIDLKSDWICEVCRTVVGRIEIANLLSALGSILRSFDEENLDVMFKFLNGLLAQNVSSNHEIVVELKCKMVWIIGHKVSYKWTDIEDRILDAKSQFCEDLLKLIETLRLGECKLKGLFLYELYLCAKEKSRRLASNITGHPENNEVDITINILKQAAVILKDDVTAPDDIKNFLIYTSRQ